MFWFCWHKWGEVKDGFQYCKKCGLALSISCNHIWNTISEGDIVHSDKIVGKMYIQKCKKCGEIKSISTYVGE